MEKLNQRIYDSHDYLVDDPPPFTHQVEVGMNSTLRSVRTPKYRLMRAIHTASKETPGPWLCSIDFKLIKQSNTPPKKNQEGDHPAIPSILRASRFD